MKRKLRVYVGTYTEPIKFGTGAILEGKGEGIYLFEMDLSTGAMTQLGLSKGIINPSYLCLSPDQSCLYSVNELKVFEGRESGSVSSFRIVPEDGRLEFLNKKATGGTDPCHVCVNEAGTHVFVSNFMSGSVSVYPLEKDGSLRDSSQFIQHTGSSVNPSRQKGPHAHSLTFDPQNRFAYVPDLGIDRLMRYEFDQKTGRLASAVTPFTAVPPGAGPRHFVFHPAGAYAYLINELASTMTAFRYEPDSGDLSELNTLSTVPSGFSGDNTCADVNITPSGRYIYGSNRGHDSLAVYNIDEASGRIKLLGFESTRGKTPRSFAIDPSGAFLLAANQDSDTIVTFRIDQEKGTLSEAAVTEVPTPVCVKPFFV